MKFRIELQQGYGYFLMYGNKVIYNLDHSCQQFINNNKLGNKILEVSRWKIENFDHVLTYSNKTYSVRNDKFHGYDYRSCDDCRLWFCVEAIRRFFIFRPKKIYIKILGEVK